MTIKFRLWAIVVLSTVCLLLVGGGGYWVSRQLGEIVETVIKLGIPSIKLLNDTDRELSSLQVALLQHQIEEDPQARERLEARSEERRVGKEC